VLGMTRKEAIRINHQESVLLSLGFTVAEAEALRRISMTLHRWSEHECNGNIERDGENGDGVPYWSNPDSGRHMICRIPDRERGALRRLAGIIDARNARLEQTATRPDEFSVRPYVQGDPRGAALYILRPGDVPEGARADGYYTRGICVY